MWIDLHFAGELLLPDVPLEGTATATAACNGYDVCATPQRYTYTMSVPLYECTASADVVAETGACNHSNTATESVEITVVAVVE